MIEKISLRKYNLGDIRHIMKLFVNDKILRPVSVPKKASEITRAYEMKWLKKTIGQYRKKNPEEYNLVITMNDEPIGGIGIGSINYYNNRAACGYWIGEPYWSRGYGTKALKVFLKEVIKKFKLVRIVAYTNDYNKASARILEKNGFRLECIRKKAVKEGRRYLNDKQYVLVK
ncbi:GNAT family N-acetyltransferase [Candidatus Pacearchaeota archaeon]|nr:GNAT family N-acetyltransferase [Candidatus Pacearchaeota archaeon]